MSASGESSGDSSDLRGSRMSGDRRDREAMLVEDCWNRLPIEPLLAHRTDDLLGIVRHAASRPQTRVVGVVDEDGRLVGIVPVLLLAEAVIARVAPEWLLAGITDLEDVARFGHEVEARTVGDVMQEPASVTPTTTVDVAYRLMRDRRISGVYVVDADGRPIGYLDLLELAILDIDTIERDQAAADEQGESSDRPA